MIPACHRAANCPTQFSSTTAQSALPQSSLGLAVESGGEDGGSSCRVSVIGCQWNTSLVRSAGFTGPCSAQEMHYHTASRVRISDVPIIVKRFMALGFLGPTLESATKE